MDTLTGKKKRLKCYHCGKIATHIATGKTKIWVTSNNVHNGTQEAVGQGQVVCGKCGKMYFTERIFD